MIGLPAEQNAKHNHSIQETAECINRRRTTLSPTSTGSSSSSSVSANSDEEWNSSASDSDDEDLDTGTEEG